MDFIHEQATDTPPSEFIFHDDIGNQSQMCGYEHRDWRCFSVDSEYEAGNFVLYLSDEQRRFLVYKQRLGEFLIPSWT